MKEPQPLYARCDLCEIVGWKGCPGCMGEGFIAVGVTMEELTRLSEEAAAFRQVRDLVRELKPAKRKVKG